MNEDLLSRELHRVANAAPIPADLLPPDLIARRGRARRSRRIATFAAAAALMLFSFTPLGAKALSAIGEIFFAPKVEVISEADRMVPSPEWPAAGQTTTTDRPDGSKVVATNLPLTDFLAAEPDWPMPTYLAPRPEEEIIRSENFRAGDDTPHSRDVNITWSSDKGHLHFYLSRLAEPMPAERLAAIRSGEEAHFRIITRDTGVKAEQREVLIHGEKAHATQIEGRWWIVWAHEYGSGALSGDLPLDEMIKVAESLPSLK